MTNDQLVWTAVTGTATAVTIPTIIALLRGWVPRSQRRHPFSPRGTALGLGFAYAGALVGSAPFTLKAPDPDGLLWMNVAFGLGVTGGLIQIAAAIHARKKWPYRRPDPT